MEFDSEKKKPLNIVPVMCGLVVGSMPALLFIPLIGGLMRWLLSNGYIFLLYIFANYLPLMIGNILGRLLGLPVFVPVAFCIFYWTVLGVYVGTKKYRKTAYFYIAVAHVLIPLVILLNLLQAFNLSGVQSLNFTQFLPMFN